MKGALPNTTGQLAEGGPLGGYRPDIDGLRAIAVAAVVIFHAGVTGLAGGFVGVDVFFVISGYLIGGQMFREVEGKTFSFAHFYTRRVRRILPALFVLLAVFLAVGCAIMTPEELKQYGKEAAASIVGASNVLFFMGGGYFGPAADYQPLLMTWSLGVEEQFYIFFPFVVLLLVRARVPALPALIGLSLLAFVGSLVLMRLSEKAAFYLLPTRSWELGIGAVLAVWQRGRPGESLSPGLATLFSVSGLALIVASLVFYRPSIAFPGWFVLAPTLGTALLIAAPGSVINRVILANPVATFIGRVSYSWYLWHWPVFYLFRLLGGRFEVFAPLALMAITFVLAVISWRFVEQPLRVRVLSGRVVLARYAAVGGVLLATMVLMYHSGGWPQRLQGQARTFAQAARTARESPCLAPYGMREPRNRETCLPSLSNDGRQALVVVGDSHASAIAPGFAQIAASRGLAFGEMTKSSCPPLAGYAATAADRPGHWAECIDYQKATYDWLDRNPGVRTVVLAGFWSSGMTVKSADGSSRSLEDALVSSVQRAKAGGRRVILVKDVPTFAFDPYARAVGNLNPIRVAVQRMIDLDAVSGAAQSSAIRKDPSHQMIDRVARRTGGEVLDPAASLCDAAGCRYGDGSRLFYFDFQHLTSEGAAEASRGFRP